MDFRIQQPLLPPFLLRFGVRCMTIVNPSKYEQGDALKFHFKASLALRRSLGTPQDLL